MIPEPPRCTSSKQAEIKRDAIPVGAFSARARGSRRKVLGNDETHRSNAGVMPSSRDRGPFVRPCRLGSERVAVVPSPDPVPGVLQIVSDGSGGAIIAWQNNGADGKDIYAQRVDASGVVLWTADGIAVCADAYDQMNPSSHR